MIDSIDVTQYTSYTNKDFESIYVELLDLVQQLTYKWDPSSSNESDPGVILLKLNALIADKCNYNIDQNVLECFPLSVTQEGNARQLFEQLGYFMHWYRSAVTNISMKWIDTIGIAEYTIPKFTMVSDYDTNIIYTLVGPTTGTVDDTFIVSSQKLSTDGSLLSWKAIQGIAVEYDLNGETLITPDMLDSNNRLYFSGTDIAENGIFICNKDKENYGEWVKKDNLLVESLGNKYYRFGVSKDMNNCYLEFPDDVATLMGEGINIVYIQTDGEYGNISTQTIEQFYNDITPEESTSENPITLNSTNVQITNSASAINGTDSETINDAYKGYKSTIGTFNTLITLRDYINAIINSGLVSTGFVCDRTNDIQSTYKIASLTNDANQSITVIEHDENGNPLLTAFSLKLYLLRYVDAVEDLYSYNQTFDMLTNSEVANVKAYIADMKSIPHDYVDIAPATTKTAHFCYFKNKYPIDCNILTQYALSATEANEVIANIRLALYEKLNAKQINFGDEITLDLIYDIVSNADSRIKAAIIDNIAFTTYGVYFDGSQYREIEISSEDLDPVDTSYTYNSPVFDSTQSYNKGSYVMHDGHRYRAKEHHNKNTDWVDADWELDEVIITSNEATFENKIGIKNYANYTFTYTKNDTESDWKLNDEVVNLSDYGITITGVVNDRDILIASISIKTQLRDDVYAKSVLAGTTQFFVKAEKFNYCLNQTFTKQIDNIEKIIPNVDITLRQGITGLPDAPEYKLRANENLQFYAPNLMDGTQFSNYVKYEYILKNDVGANTDYQLQSGEFFIFYWKEQDSNDALYQYALYGQGNIFKATFDLSKNTNTGSIVGYSLVPTTPDGWRNWGTITDPVYIKNSEVDGDMDSSLSDSIGSLTGSNTVLSGTRTITRREMNKVTINSSYYCYWVLNEKKDGNYVLFEENKDDPTATQSRMLRTGEYFLYSSDALTDLIILGSGTELIKNNSASTWEVPIIETNKLLSEGTNVLKDYWIKIPATTTIDVIENQYLTVGSGCSVKVEPKTNEYNFTITVDGNATVDKTTFIQSDIVTAPYTKEHNYVFNYIELQTTTGVEGYWKYGDTFAELPKYGITVTKTPVVGDTITIYVTTSWEMKISREGVKCDRSLSEFNISYRTSDSSEYEALEDITLISHDGWNIISMLGISCSPTEIQRLLNNQSITYYVKDDKETHMIVGSDATDTVYPVAMLASLSIDTDGSSSFATSYEDDYGEMVYLSLYQFQETLSDNLRGLRFYDNDNAIFDFDAGETKKEITFSIPKGEYILKLNNPTAALTKLIVSIDDVPLHSMYDENYIDFYSSGIHYLYMKLEDEKPKTLSIEISEYIDTYTVTISDCYRYEPPEGMTREYFDKIYKLINVLDNEKHAFDYTIEIGDDENIENPLSAKSFFNSNHIYNKFTICQFDTSKNTNIRVAGIK